jgi:hypothetical protein
MLDGCLQLGSENLDHMEMEYMDLYFQQLEWSALEIKRITSACNMHYMRKNHTYENSKEVRKQASEIIIHKIKGLFSQADFITFSYSTIYKFCYWSNFCCATNVFTFKISKL